MTESFKNSESFDMNSKKFRNHVYEFCRFEDERSIQISSVVIKLLQSYPSTRIKVENEPVCVEF